MDDLIEALEENDKDAIDNLLKQQPPLRSEAAALPLPSTTKTKAAKVAKSHISETEVVVYTQQEGPAARGKAAMSIPTTKVNLMEETFSFNTIGLGIDAIFNFGWKSIPMGMFHFISLGGAVALWTLLTAPYSWVDWLFDWLEVIPTYFGFAMSAVAERFRARLWQLVVKLVTGKNPALPAPGTDVSESAAHATAWVSFTVMMLYFMAIVGIHRRLFRNGRVVVGAI